MIVETVWQGRRIMNPMNEYDLYTRMGCVTDKRRDNYVGILES